jgi:nucleotide-binding universal stress UspA family protein
MPSILVPVDFSPSSLNAALYAAHFAKIINARSITLVTVIAEMLAGSDGSPIMVEVEEQKAGLRKQFEELQVFLYEKARVPTEFEVLVGSFEKSILAYEEQNGFDLVVLGVTHVDALETFFGTSHSLEFLKKSKMPVLVVPEEAVFTTGFNKKIDISLLVDNHYKLPMDTLTKWVEWLKPKIHITHVNDKLSGKASTEESNSLENLYDIFLKYEPEIHILNGLSFSQAVNDFAKKYSIEMLFAFPAKHQFLGIQYTGSHTKKLVFHSQVPVMCFPAEEE